MFSSLVYLLLNLHPAASSLGNKDKMETVWGDLAVKCCIKMTKMLPATIQVSALATHTHTHTHTDLAPVSAFTCKRPRHPLLTFARY